MRAGPLRDRITLQTKTTGHDAAGGLIDVISDTTEMWARAIPRGTKEYERIDRLETSAAMIFQIRHRPGIDATDRVLWRSRTFDVQGYENIDERGREGAIYCSEVL